MPDQPQPSTLTPVTISAPAPLAYSCPDLCRIIQRVESSDNISAVRFEPLVFSGMAMEPREHDFIQKIADWNHCNWNTARVIFSTSFGFYQLMGFNIYSLGMEDCTISHFWVDPELQRLAFTNFLRRENINWRWTDIKQNSTMLRHFAVTYNGPGQPDAYMGMMLRAAKELGL